MMDISELYRGFGRISTSFFPPLLFWNYTLIFFGAFSCFLLYPLFLLGF